jgi:long-chain acyl-CoA synthetase
LKKKEIGMIVIIKRNKMSMSVKNMSAEKFWVKSYDPGIKATLSYPSGGLGNLFLKAISEHPDKIACYYFNTAMKFSQLIELAKKLATALQKNGLKKGDVVLINLVNCPQYVIAALGTLLAGGVISGCSPLLSEDELAYQLNHSEAKAIITLDAVYDKLLMKKLADKVPKLQILIPTSLAEYMGFSKIKVFLGKLLKKIPSGKIKPWPGKTVLKWKDIVETPADVKEISIGPDDLCLLPYTGGTTGRPKGTMLTHKNMVAQVTQFGHWLALETGSGTTLSAFPYFHMAGTLVYCQSLYLAWSQILIPNPRDTTHLIEDWEKHLPTMIANVPTLYNMILNNPKYKEIPKSALDNVIAYISGAAPFPVKSIKEFEAAMGAENKVVEVYGMTEASPLVSSNPFKKEKKIGTVGLPLPDTDIKLINIETGEPVPIGEPGEILVKGPQIMKGYYKSPDATAKALEGGYLHTGDVGVFDQDGYLKIVDRIKDMLNVSGYKVYSVHVEDILTKHPDIEICAIIGLEDLKRPGSEIVKAFIKLKEGVTANEAVKQSIQKYAEENLSKYEVPKQWEFREELPLTLVGKVLKRELRDQPSK